MTSTVPISRSSYVSGTPDEAWDALSRMYTNARPHAASADASIRFNGASTPDIAVDRGWLGKASGSFDTSPGQLNFVCVTGGRIGLDFGRRGAISNVAGDSYLYLPDSSAELDWESFGALTLRLSPDVVARSAAEQTGLRADALRFTSPSPLSPAGGRLWFKLLEMLWATLTQPGPAVVNALVHHELLNLISATAISVFPNTGMTLGYVPGPGDVRPAAVRRAVAYIDAHASLPISVTDVADAAGTTPSALRTAFSRHLDTTPTEYLRRVRLEGAHRDLQDADPATGVTVAGVAARWGFGPATHFTRWYRQQYGVAPRLRFSA